MTVRQLWATTLPLIDLNLDKIDWDTFKGNDVSGVAIYPYIHKDDAFSASAPVTLVPLLSTGTPL